MIPFVAAAVVILAILALTVIAIVLFLDNEELRLDNLGLSEENRRMTEQLDRTSIPNPKPDNG